MIVVIVAIALVVGLTWINVRLEMANEAHERKRQELNDKLGIRPRY